MSLSGEANVPAASSAGLDAAQYFDNSRKMNIKTAVGSLAALAQDSRLEVFRLLVQAGTAGLAAGEIAQRLEIPASTLSFHVKALAHAGLIASRQDGRHIYYSASYAAMNELIAFLSENCCGGRACLPLPGAARRKRAS
jgi:ArsR family transcriptional regulator